MHRQLSLVRNTGFVGGFSVATIVFTMMILTMNNDHHQVENVVVIKDPHWKSYKTIHLLEFNPNEEIIKYDVFKENLEYIRKHKSDKYSVAMNKFAHLTNEEFLKQQAGRIKSIKTREKKDPQYISLPDSIDWRKQLGKVKEQKNCASSWAFSTVSALESSIKIHKNINVKLSEQELIDCTLKYNNHGCNGGMGYQALDYVKQEGIGTTYGTAYSASEGICRRNSTNSIKISGYREIVEGDEADLCSALVTHGPIIVSLNISPKSYQFYKSGVIDEENCDSNNLNHEALLIGYTKEHYILQNSWGQAWGMSGFFMLPRFKNNACGIASHAVVPLI